MCTTPPELEVRVSAIIGLLDAFGITKILLKGITFSRWYGLNQRKGLIDRGERFIKELTPKSTKGGLAIKEWG